MRAAGSLLRVARLFALVVWVGGLIFFAFVVAPVAFHRLPSTHDAGLVVGGTLRMLHGMGLVAGVVYVMAALAGAKRRGWWIGSALIAVMLLLTAVSQWGVLPRMETDRVAAGGSIGEASATNAARLDFDRLHVLSERMEGGVLLLGLAVVVLTGLEWTPEERA